MQFNIFLSKFGLPVYNGLAHDIITRYRESHLSLFSISISIEDVANAARILLSNGFDISRPTFFQRLKIVDDELQALKNISLRMSSMLSVLLPPREAQISEEFADTIVDIRHACEIYAEDAAEEQIRVLSIDIETFSGEDISNGVYKYSEASDFEILLFSYSLNGGAVHIVDLAQGEAIPEKILTALTDGAVLKTAYNALFERVCLTRYLRLTEPLDPAQWECTMVRAAMMGLPMSLDACGTVLQLRDKKMKEGVALIKYFSCPCKPTKANGMRTRNFPADAPEKWEIYKKYNRRDVEVEVEIRKRVSADDITTLERNLYIADQRIGDRGVKIEQALMTNAIRFNNDYCARLEEECKRLTGLDNPNSATQLKNWLSKQLGHNITSLTKDSYAELMPKLDGDARRVLEIRTEMAKTSVSKYTAMSNALCQDGRVHGMLQFYGSRTGRWAGRIVQVQNLPKNSMRDLAFARKCVMGGDLELTEMLYGNIPDTLSQLVRTAFVAGAGNTFMVCDFSAIEARVIAWLAGEQWRLDIFKGGGKIYEASAAHMFGVPVEGITHDSPLRARGKIAELALGYQGGVGALAKMGGEKMGLSEDEMQKIVNDWRAASPHIVGLWRSIENAAGETVNQRVDHRVNGLIFRMCGDMLRIQLPSRRWLSYPQICADGNNGMSFMGQNQVTRRWEEIDTYGGKLVENIVQAIARDCLGVTILRLEEAGFPVVFHIHDECVCEVPDDGAKTLEEMQAIFSEPMPFAPDLPLAGAGYATKYYLKD